MKLFDTSNSQFDPRNVVQLSQTRQDRMRVYN